MCYGYYNTVCAHVATRRPGGAGADGLPEHGGHLRVRLLRGELRRSLAQEQPGRELSTVVKQILNEQYKNNDHEEMRQQT